MGLLPRALEYAVEEALAAAGDRGGVRGISPVYGGDINDAARVDTAGRSYFLKWNDDSPAGMFPAEARGLALIRQAGELLVPDVLAATDASAERPGFLLESWIEAAPGAFGSMGAAFGEQLAGFQRKAAAGAPGRYGLDEDNYIGVAVQSNGWSDSWIAFFREQRLRRPAAIAARRGLIDPDLHRGIEELADRLGHWLEGVERTPVLLHGDLWSGNVLFTREGRLALVDPAVYWGDREFDLATTEIYHQAPSGFWSAYEAAWPCAPGRLERRGIYHISLWLHCILCGQQYRYQIDSQLRRYLG